MIRYQGHAVDSAGVPLEGPYTLIFRLYDAETAGQVRWEETQPNVPLTGGHCSVLLGSMTSLATVDWLQPLWLGVQVNTESELSPRQRLTSVPLALRSESALQADQATMSADLADHQRVLGPIRVAGNDIGIGTAAPAHRLDVQGGSINAASGLCMAGDCRASWASVAPPGARILAIRQAKTSSGTNLASTWQDVAGLSIDVTPASSNSKFMVVASAGAGCISSGCGSSGEWIMRLVRDSTPLQTLISDEGGAEGRSAMHPMTFTYFDQPATTASVRYKLQAASMAYATFRVPGTAGSLGVASDGVITVIEVGGL